MKPLVVRSQDGRGQSPVKVDETPKPPERPRKSGEGAKSALEHLIQQERARVLGSAAEPPERPPVP